MAKFSTAQVAPNVLGHYFAEMAAVPVLSAEQEAAAIRSIEEMEGGLLAEILGHRGFARSVLKELMKAMEVEDIPADEFTAALRSRDRRALVRSVKFHDPGRAWMAAAMERASRTSYMVALGMDQQSAKRWCSSVRLRRAEVSAAKNRFVEANLRLVVTIAKKYCRPGMSSTLSDLIQEGNLGLMKAVDRFDVDRGYKFSTYSMWWIRHHVKRAIEEKDSMIRIPVHLVDNIHKVNRAEASIRMVTGEEAEVESLAEATGLVPAKVRRAIEHRTTSIVSMQSQVGPDEGMCFGDLMPGPEPGPDEELYRTRLKSEIRKLLTALTPFESQIVRWRLGLDGEDELTLQQIAEKYGLSRERIRQIQERAFEKMRYKSVLREYR